MSSLAPKQNQPQKPLSSSLARPNMTPPERSHQEHPAPVPPTVHQVLSSSGQPLDPDIRAFLEPRFGHDFSRVRVHTDTKASESAEAVDASAYTVGRHIVFGERQYVPWTTQGGIRLAHELAHVVQQDFRVPPVPRIGEPDLTAESEAQHAAMTVIHGGRLRPLHGVHSGMIQMDRRTPQPGKPASGEKTVAVKDVTKRQALTDVIQDLSGSMSEKDWEAKKRAAIEARDNGDSGKANAMYLELYSEIARLAQADRLGDGFGTQVQDINIAKTDNDLKPGLNFSLAFSAHSGKTSYIDEQGSNHEAKLPITLSGLPGIAVVLGPNAFTMNKAAALATLRHEMMHAEIDRLAINQLKRWQDQNKGKVKANEAESKFDQWLDSRKKSISPLEFDLTKDKAKGRTGSSELLSYVEGFMTIFHLERVPKEDEISKVENTSSRALLDLKTAGDYWTGANESVQSEVLGRIQQYYCDVLDKPRQDVFNKWVTSKLQQAGSTEKLSEGEKATRNALLPIVPFLKNLKSISCGKTTRK